MGPEKIIVTGAQAVPNFLQSDEVQFIGYTCMLTCAWMGAMRCNIGKNHTILCAHVDHKCCMLWSENKLNTLVMCDGIL